MPNTSLSSAAAALAVVLGLIWMLQRFARAGWFRTALGEPATGRLAVAQSLPLDAKRRLVIISCDGRELLLLTGGAGGDVVVGWLGAGEGR